jgi:hypothetical protein
MVVDNIIQTSEDAVMAVDAGIILTMKTDMVIATAQERAAQVEIATMARADNEVVVVAVAIARSENKPTHLDRVNAGDQNHDLAAQANAKIRDNCTS